MSLDTSDVVRDVAIPGAFYFRSRQTTTRQTGMSGNRPIRSIAVLPFANAGGDPNLEYLGDGIASTVTASLSQLNGSSSQIVIVMRYVSGF